MKDATGSFDLGLVALAFMLFVSAGLTLVLRKVTREI